MNPVPTDAQIERALRRAWFPVAIAAQLDRPRAATLLGERLAVFRTEDRAPAVVRDQCPHRGAALSLGSVEGDAIVCAYHGWRWRGSDGACLHIPSLGEHGAIPPRAVVDSFPCAERWGLIWCALEEPANEIPDPPELRGLDWTYAAGRPIPVQAGIRSATENFRDVAHFPFVHRATMGHIPAVIEPLQVRREGVEVWMERDYRAQGGQEELWHPSRFRYHAIAPAFVCLIFDSGPRGRRILLNAPTPVGRDECVIHWVEGITPDFTAMTLEECLEGEGQVYDEDTPILDSLQPPEAPLDVSAQVHTPADRYTLEYRRAFVEFVDYAAARG